MWLVFLDLPARIEARNRCMFVLPLAHELDGVLLVADHFARSERAARSARFLLYSNELTGPNTLLELRPNLSESRIPHRTPQRIPQKIPFLDHRLTLQVPLLRKRHRRLRHLGRHVPLGVVRSVPGCLHDSLGLTTEGLRDLSMPLLHLFM